MEQYIQSNLSADFASLLLVAQDGRELQVGGYHAYNSVNTAHNPETQPTKTKVLNSEEHKAAAMFCIPHLKDIYALILTETCLNGEIYEDFDEGWLRHLVDFHFLCQDDTRQASFAWHCDDEELPGRMTVATTQHLLTVVVQLSESLGTAMGLFGFGKVRFTGRGAAVAFHGSAPHGSYPWVNEEGTHVWKVTFFVKVPCSHERDKK